MSCEARMVAWAAALTDNAFYPDLGRLLPELPNLLVAIRWACHRNDTQAALCIAGASVTLEAAERFELIGWAETALALPGSEGCGRWPRICANLAQDHVWYRPDAVRARSYAQRAIEADPDSAAGGWGLHALATLDSDMTRMDDALALGIRHDPMLEMSCRSQLANSIAPTDPVAAWHHAQACDQLALQVGEPWARVMSTLVQGMALCPVDPNTAIDLLREGAEMAERIGMTMLANAGLLLAGLAGEAGDPINRVRMAQRGLAAATERGSRGWLGAGLTWLANAFNELGMPDRAAVLAGAALANQVEGVNGTAPVFRDTARIAEQLKHEYPAQYARGLVLPSSDLLRLVDDWVSDLPVARP